MSPKEEYMAPGTYGYELTLINHDGEKFQYAGACHKLMVLLESESWARISFEGDIIGCRDLSSGNAADPIRSVTFRKMVKTK